MDYPPIHAFIVCVNYGAQLALGLHRWMSACTSLTVVTDHKDAATAAVCKSHVLSYMGVGGGCRLRVHMTDCFYQDGAAFNKGRALQAAISASPPEQLTDWVLFTDADIVPPIDIRFRLQSQSLKPGRLHGAHRYQATLENVYLACELPRIRMISIPGAFQLFHAQDPHLGAPQTWLRTDFVHAGNYDTVFQNRWGHEADRTAKTVLDLGLRHVGTPGHNWFGVHDDPAEGEKKMQDMYAERRRRGGAYDHETIGQGTDTK